MDMDLTDDGFWSFVEKLSARDGSGLIFKCKFCGQQFAATTSITRLKWHWSGVEGHGVRPCPRVAPDLQEAALLAIQQPPNKKRKTTMPSSSNMIGAISTFTPGQINQVGNLMGGLARMQLEQEALGEGTASPHAHDHDMEKMTEGLTQPRGDARQATDQVSGVDIEAMDWQAIASIAQLFEDEEKNGTTGLVQPVSGASSSRGFPYNTSRETRRDALPTRSTKLVGQAFEEHKNAIWSWLMEDEASPLGIYGMGGVGKTSLMKLVYNQLKKTPDTFQHVYWISVSQDFSIYKLQSHIAKCLGLDLADEDDEWQRARMLLEEFLMKQQPILILDDVWNSFDLETVGIPVQENGCKLILTTRSLRVCREMGCLQKIKVEPLSQEEAWTLFTENLKHDIVLSPEVEEIAKSVTMECAGLPLAIVTIARSMRGVNKIHEWRNTFTKLEESKVRDMEDKVFRLLRFSYDRLDGSALRQCFLYCALFPEDNAISRSDLIDYLIDEGIVGRMKSRQAEFDEGHTMLDKLENVCLLESCYDGFAVKMHDLLRDMALQIQREKSQVMIKIGENLVELEWREMKEWNVNLVRFSLMNNEIYEIPWSHSPRCPNLSTMLLCGDRGLQFIADSFFKQFNKLMVLDLSNTRIKILPDSVSDLANLNGLLLRHCWKLRRVPSLKKLRVLRRLDLKKTVLENIPEGMEWLSNLRYLRVGTCGQTEFPIEMLRRLSHLQVFIQEVGQKFPPVAWVKGKEIAYLRKLEILQCYFEHLSDLEEYLKSWDEIQSLSSYGLYVGVWAADDHDNLEDHGCTYKTVGINFGLSRARDLQVMFPNDMKKLRIYNCNDATSLCDISSSIKNATKLEVIDIEYCDVMESLLSPSWFCSAPLELPSSHGLFPHLRNLICYGCKSLKKLFPLVLLPHLVNLEEIEDGFSFNLEEIIATTDEVGDTGEEYCCSYSLIAEFCLPKLRCLRLHDLPELKSICTAKLKCNSLQEIHVLRCPKLKRMPFSLPLIGNSQPSPPPSLRDIYMDQETWESVEWDHPNAKDILLPFTSNRFSF